MKYDPSICSRCKEAVPTIETRKESFCEPCFLEFVSLKARRPLERFRVNWKSDHVPKVLVPVDFSTNSLVLVHLLEDLLRFQREKNMDKVGFEMVCAYIGDDKPEWPFKSKIIYLSKDKLFNTFTVDGHNLKDDRSLSRTSRQDLESKLRHKLHQEIAAKESLECILYDYSMTYLSELVLAETVKGRGSLIPQLLKPNETIAYPLRDILDTELTIYADACDLSKYAAPLPAVPRVSKLQSIDELIHKYFVDVQKEYRAVVATVTRTASKFDQEPEPCFLCETSSDVEKLCYGCKAMLNTRDGEKDLKVQELEDILEAYEL